MKFVKAGYHGLYFPDLGLALDGYHSEATHIFISHAHADHMIRNSSANVFASAPTLELMERRGYKGKQNALQFKKWIEADKFRATIFPAGHILGSSMIYVEADFGTLLYTGDCRTPPSPASEGFELPETVDYLIIEATFGLPIYKWKSNDELADEIRNFATETLNNGYTPVFLGYSLGKSQEIMHILSDLDHPIMIHGAGFKLCDVYENHGFSLGNYSAYRRDECEGKILIAPSSALANGFASNVSKKRVAYCSGWAANESRRWQLTADKLIPISDHLDFFELIKVCTQLSPKKVYITHTPNPKVVQHYLEQKNIASAFLEMEYDSTD